MLALIYFNSPSCHNIHSSNELLNWGCFIGSNDVIHEPNGSQSIRLRNFLESSSEIGEKFCFIVIRSLLNMHKNCWGLWGLNRSDYCYFHKVQNFDSSFWFNRSDVQCSKNNIYFELYNICHSLHSLIKDESRQYHLVFHSCKYCWFISFFFVSSFFFLLS